MQRAESSMTGPVRHRLLGALAAYVGLLWLYRPMTPFEWDEVLFLRALERYDVGAHSPHPPGYPLYVALGKLLELVAGDGLTALQLLSVLSAGAAVVLVWVLARRFGLGVGQATAAAAVLALTPAFAFNANVGLSDVPGVAATLAAALLLFDSISDRRRLAAAAAATAAAVAVRPQLAVALLPLGIAALLATVRRRNWRDLATAVATGLLVSAAIWGPAVLLTGADRFLAKLDETARWMAINEADGRIGGAALEPLLRHWTVYPFVGFALAAPLWVLLAWGGRRLWRDGSRTAVVIATASAGSYLAAALFTLHMSTSVRYILPAMPFLALLSGGLLTPGKRRPLRIAAVTGWLVATIVVAGPAYEIRARRPAPAWEALQWIATRPPEERRVLVAMDEFLPHARHVLAGSGTTIIDPEPGDGYDWRKLAPEGGVLLLTRFPVPQSQVLLKRWWNVDAITRLGRRRYQRATVSRLPLDGSLEFTTDWGERKEGIELRVAGRISLPADGSPRLLRFSPDRDVVFSRNWPHEKQSGKAGDSIELVLLPGRHALFAVPPGRATLFTDLECHRLGAGSSLIVGPLAHVEGVGGAQWRSDLDVRNSTLEPIVAAVELFLDGRSQPWPVVRVVTVPPSGNLRLEDVVNRLFHAEGAAYLRILPEQTGLAVVATTYDARQPANSALTVAGVPPPESIPEGESLVLSVLTADRVRHSNVGILNLGPHRVSLMAALVADDGRSLLDAPLELGPGELRQFSNVLRSPDGSTVRASVVLTPAGSPAQIVAWGSVVDASRGRSYLVTPHRDR